MEMCFLEPSFYIEPILTALSRQLFWLFSGVDDMS